LKSNQWCWQVCSEKKRLLKFAKSYRRLLIIPGRFEDMGNQTVTSFFGPPYINCGNSNWAVLYHMLAITVYIGLMSLGGMPVSEISSHGLLKIVLFITYFYFTSHQSYPIGISPWTRDLISENQIMMKTNRCFVLAQCTSYVTGGRTARTTGKTTACEVKLRGWVWFIWRVLMHSEWNFSEHATAGYCDCGTALSQAVRQKRK